ncbi:PD-(D/E)XK nuclease family protein [Cytobacillus oceanisediminis]|uniref:PD-(D/E)XK nuclease family protein n=1 Tax=Cytobacillus oceanisediminis TaxID=665099 RepID=UPI003736A495
MMNTIALLNSFYREDVITDLISNLINSEENYAKWFARSICDVSDTDARFVSKTRISLGRGIGTPDLVIERKVNYKTDLIIVIENKLGALEGAEQTNRYASDKGKGKLYSTLKVEQDVPIKFLFLTLDPYTPAKNSSFDKKDYLDFVHVDWNNVIKDEAARKIMYDFSSLLKEFYEPITSAKLTDNIAAKTKNLNALQKKLIWIKMLQTVQDTLPNRLTMTFGEAGGFGRNAAVFLFSKREWLQNRFDGEKLLANSMNIHFELSINLLNFSKVSDFALHYEPNPYKPKKDYSNVEGYKEYELLREKRYDYLHQLIKDLDQKELFAIRKGSNSILRININNNQRFEDVVRELIAVMEKLTPLIDHMVNIS